MSNYTKLPNHIVDAMPDMSKSELKVTIAIVRHTYGFHKESCELTFSELQELTGMSRGGVSAGAKAVVERGFFTHYGSTWSVCSLDQSSLINEPESSLTNRSGQSNEQTEAVYPVDQISLNTRPESVYSLDQNTPVLKKKENYKERILTQLSNHFTAESGCMPNAGTYADDWESVLDEWQERYGDKTTDMVTRAVKFARGDNPQRRRYTITSPRSIANIMANLEPTNQSNGAISVGAR